MADRSVQPKFRWGLVAVVCLAVLLAFFLGRHAPTGFPGFAILPLALFVGGLVWAGVAGRQTVGRMHEDATRRDGLTGLMNRAAFTDRAEKLFDRSAGSGVRHGVLILDVDQISAINELHGNRLGDAVLRHVAETLENELRKGDLVARYGGDEFVVVMANIGAEDLEGAAHRLQTILCDPIEFEGSTLGFRVSVGTCLARVTDGLDRALQAAERALAHANICGPATIVAHSRDLDRKRDRRRMIEAALADPWTDNRANLVFQPVIDAKSHRIAGFEALARLRTEDGEEIQGDEFAPVAEQSGLIRAFGRQVMQRAMLAAKDWPDDIFLAVNLSPAQFRHGDLVEEVRWLIDTTGFPTARLELEITENLALDEEPEVQAQFEGLKALGISIAMDDFGTGYSSLGYLLSHDFDKLKIDRMFVQDLSADPLRQRQILKSVIDLAQRLGLTVTMEGVETAEQVAMLDELGCDRYQGYYFSQPLSEAEATRIIGMRAKNAV